MIGTAITIAAIVATTAAWAAWLSRSRGDEQADEDPIAEGERSLAAAETSAEVIRRAVAVGVGVGVGAALCLVGIFAMALVLITAIFGILVSSSSRSAQMCTEACSETGDRWTIVEEHCVCITDDGRRIPAAGECGP